MRYGDVPVFVSYYAAGHVGRDELEESAVRHNHHSNTVEIDAEYN